MAVPRARTDEIARYLRVAATFARNSLVRDMTFRANFLIDAATSIVWMLMNLAFYVLIFSFTTSLGVGTGWGKYQFFVFLATGMFINSLVQAFFMPNANEFGEHIRTGRLDFALVKPIDTQFLVSLSRIEWSSLSNFAVAAVLLGYSLVQIGHRPSVVECVLYPFYVLCGVAVLYSLMMPLAACAVWLGRNESLYDYWFYVINFSRYPMEIYRGTYGTPLRLFFTYMIPVLIVVNVPARLLAKPLDPDNWWLAICAFVATLASLAVSRWIFQRALASYRSASS
ncbi:MAG: ABC-2 family transporter protein [Pirellulales bacterium]|nr:ABC-2 family transporter protein [Pirellulales bacterium]